MSMPAKTTLSVMCAQAYEDGLAFHSDLGMTLIDFENRLRAVIDKHLGIDPPIDSALTFLRKLHLTDLYLASGCSEANEFAWRRFVALYSKHINDIARSVTASRDAGSELAADVLSSLFLHDRSGRSRIASYDGQQSLQTWLVAVISYRATNDALRKWNSFARVDLLSDLEDQEKATKIEADLRASSYRGVIRDCFMVASTSLTDRERLILLLRFDDGLRITEIAKHLKVDSSGITRLLQRTYEKLRRRMMSYLASTRHLGPAAIKECLSDMLENPEHSIMALIRESSDNDFEQANTKAG